MPDRDVAFLDALRVIRRDIQEKINLALKLPARFSGKRDEIRSSSAASFRPANDVGAIAACRERDKNVLLRNK